MASAMNGMALHGGVRPYGGTIMCFTDYARPAMRLSALMAVLHAKGKMKSGESFIGRSIIESRFIGRIVEETLVGGRPAIVPEISGRGWITGTSTLMLDPDDPWPDGYKISDTWPKDA